MRFTPSLALAATLALGAAGCVYIPLGNLPKLDVTSLASGTLAVKVKPTVKDGGYRTQTVIDPWTRASIDHVVLDVYKLVGDSEKEVFQSVENTTARYQIKLSGKQLDTEFTFKNLAPATRYRLRARAYSAANENDETLISDGKTSFLDVDLKTEDRLVALALPIQLLDKLFDGQASSSIDLRPGALRQNDERVELGPCAGLAPDDTGYCDVHHDYVVTKNGIESTFVWIPRFQAYQLIQPANCGDGNTDKPVGYWVAKQPAGQENADWAVETFGGFYAGKYEASRADAIPGNPSDGSGATEGASNALKVARYMIPWTAVSSDRAKAACADYDPACHLMTDEEWTALAVWSMSRGVSVLGNNSRGKDHDDTGVTFVPRPDFGNGGNYQTLTGSGQNAGWSGKVNLTTHTGQTDGVYDLNGNVTEWTAGLGMAGGPPRYTVNGADTGVIIPANGSVTSLNANSRWRRYGLPAGTTGNPAFFGQDVFEAFSATVTVSNRGGYFESKGSAGMWALTVLDSKFFSGLNGFRPALRF